MLVGICHSRGLRAGVRMLKRSLQSEHGEHGLFMSLATARPRDVVGSSSRWPAIAEPADSLTWSGSQSHAADRA
jgi:hypothetical protein